MKKKVRGCFGNYGNRDLEIERDGNKKIGCTLLCRDYKLCSQCYWSWYFLRKHKKLSKGGINRFIKEFMKRNKLKF